MEDEIVREGKLRGFKSLNDRIILYWIVKRKKPIEIAPIINRNVDTIRTRLTWIYKQLGIKGENKYKKDILIEQYGKLVEEVINPDGSFKPPKPTIEEPKKEEPKEEEPEVSIPLSQEEPIPAPPIFYPREEPKREKPESPKEIPSEPIIFVPPPQPIRVESRGPLRRLFESWWSLWGLIVIGVISIGIFVGCLTLVMMIVGNLGSAVSSQRRPTPTLFSTPIPTTQPIKLPFEDLFLNGMRPEWKIVGPVPVASEGKLSSEDETSIFLFDNAWKNYSVDVTIAKQYGGGFNFIFIRAKAPTDAIACRAYFRLLNCYFIIGDEWIEIPGTDVIVTAVPHYRPPLNPLDFQYSITVVDDSVNVSIGGYYGTEFTIPPEYKEKYATGGVGIKFAEGVEIEYVTISER